MEPRKSRWTEYVSSLRECHMSPYFLADVPGSDAPGIFSNTHLLLRYGFVIPNLHNSTCLTKVKLPFQAVDHFQRDVGSTLQKAIGKSLAFTLDTCPGEGQCL